MPVMMKCPRCEGKGVVEMVADKLTLASLLEPVMTDDMIGFRLKKEETSAQPANARPALYQLPALEKTEWFGSVAEAIHGKE